MSGSSMRKVAFLSNQGRIAGGEVMLLAMAGLAARHYDVVVVGPDSPSDLADACAGRGLRYIPVARRGRISYFANLRRVVRRENFDLLWCNGAGPGLATSLLPERRVLHLHQRIRPIQRLPMALARLGVVVTVVPSLYLSSVVEHSFVLRNWCSEVLAEPTAAPSKTRIGFLGRVSSDKGVDVLARAFGLLLSEHPDAELVIAGDGRFVSHEQQQAVERAIDDLPKRPIELGWVSPATLFAACDIVVVPSTWEEPFGLVAIEAMSAAVPLLVSSAGALPELVGHDYPWIFAAQDATALAARISEMSEDPEQTAFVAAQAKIRWRERFSVEANAERFMELLASASADGDQ